MLRGRGYTLKIEFGENKLTYIQPNRISIYQRVKPKLFNKGMDCLS